MSKTIARAYVKALLELGDSKQWLDALKSLVELVSTPELQAALNAPVVDQKQLAACLKTFCIDQHVDGLIDILAQHRRLALINSIYQLFIEELQKQHGVQKAEMTTAMPLTEALQKSISASLATDQGRLEVSYQVNPDLLAGGVLRIGDQVIDGSLQTQLKQLRTQLRNQQIVV